MRVILPGQPVLDGRFLFQATAAEAVDGAEILEMLSAVADIGARGGFTAGAIAPKFVVHRTNFDTHTFRADLEMAAIDGRFLECLRSSLVASGKTDAYIALELLAAANGNRHELPYPDEVDGRPVYPARRIRLQFVLTIDATITSRMRRLVLTMRGPQSPTEIAAVEDWITPWANALVNGAFVLPHIDPEIAANVFGGVQLFEEDSIEIVVDRFDSSEEAFDVLINMLDRFASDHAAIRRVDLY
ncbi:hypothetical protein [Mesorhizobium captivum]|uniref:hypothetical protein n=1 Tax=Mesorhizobium captivum TaxID=3072319 RepID=UPI002A23A0AE|nr:hypothetical protein [Mesorhizobium sp. VK22E]MDX8507950.1 hypothetical protein [Mesorhizobium sp. VK22E]